MFNELRARTKAVLELFVDVLCRKRLDVEVLLLADCEKFCLPRVKPPVHLLTSRSHPEQAAFR